MAKCLKRKRLLQTRAVLQIGLHFEAFYASWISLEDKYYLQKGGQDLRQKVDSAVNNLVQGH